MEKRAVILDMKAALLEKAFVFMCRLAEALKAEKEGERIRR